ncbi:hypothetical protein K875_00044 [Mycobacterium [tuberculosis] TKK-01-0051]|uniref:Uncharacterized protein n=1 Tax=Mycobacterium [tuberculosis] TKK-01-0051 TaxID=1324261 RepID=A0A051UJD9_9MYCO|nr:hypothetical protein [Mycobacterium colombiense]KBZ69329.1 hypothetical protein K875_00044 [Mycobacterium [tuberculosis] TKK-01-0051]
MHKLVGEGDRDEEIGVGLSITVGPLENDRSLSAHMITPGGLAQLFRIGKSEGNVETCTVPFWFGCRVWHQRRLVHPGRTHIATVFSDPQPHDRLG